MTSKNNLLRPLFLACAFALSSCSLSPEAQFYQAVAAYQQGQYAEAASIFKKLAEQGYAKPQHNLGMMYYDGYGVKKDYATAFYWLEKAAAQGEDQAQTNLGVFYAKGYGVKQDYAKARYWFEKAAAQGNDNAQKGLELLRQMGH